MNKSTSSPTGSGRGPERATPTPVAPPTPEIKAGSAPTDQPRPEAAIGDTPAAPRTSRPRAALPEAVPQSATTRVGQANTATDKHGDPGGQPTKTADLRITDPGSKSVVEGASQVRTHPHWLSRREPPKNQSNAAATPDKPELMKPTTDVSTTDGTDTPTAPNGYRREFKPAPEPPLYQKTVEATKGEAGIPDNQSSTSELPPDELTEADKPSLEELFKGLGENPSSRITQDKIVPILQELPENTEVEIVYGEGVRRVISEMKSGSDIPPITIYGEKYDQETNTMSWYVDLLHRTDEGLPPEKQDSIPRKITLVKTSIFSSEEFIAQVNEMNPTSIKKAAIDAGELHHLVASLNWKKYYGPNHDPEFKLKEGGRPDVGDEEARRLGELGSIPHAMEKVVKTGWYVKNAQIQYGGTWTGEVYVYDHNRQAWQALYARKQQEKQERT